MSNKATRGSKAVNQALRDFRRKGQEASIAARAAKLSHEAIEAAITAKCSAEDSDAVLLSGEEGTTSVAELYDRVALVAQEAVDRAKEAVSASDAGDTVSAVIAANASAQAAQRAASLSAAASIIAGKSKALPAEDKRAEPALSADEQLEAALRAARKRAREEFAKKLDRSARYLLVYGGKILGAFARLDDALLLEAELCQLDVDKGALEAHCEVLDRKGTRYAGYLITSGKLVTFVSEEHAGRRSGQA